MILVDASIWLHHLRAGAPDLEAALDGGLVSCHPFVIDELACGNLRNRSEILELLSNLPALSSPADHEVLDFFERRRLMGRGVGYIDVHLLAAVVLEPAARLWTHDRRLAALASELGVAHGHG